MSGSALAWLSESPLAQALTAYPTLYIFVNAAHILSIGLLAGAILPLDLRVLGITGRAPLAVIGPFLSRAAMVGVMLAMLTGAMLFTTKAPEYASNPAFLTKMGLLATGIGNALLLRANPAWKNALQSDSPGIAVKVGAGISLAVWIAAVVAGRWIGFV